MNNQSNSSSNAAAGDDDDPDAPTTPKPNREDPCQMHLIHLNPIVGSSVLDAIINRSKTCGGLRGAATDVKYHQYDDNAGLVDDDAMQLTIRQPPI